MNDNNMENNGFPEPSLSAAVRSESARDRDIALEKCSKIGKPELINLFNYINFQDEEVLLNFRHRKTNTIISIKAKTEPCTEDTVRCLWVSESGPDFNLSSYDFDTLFLLDGQHLVILSPDNPVEPGRDGQGIDIRIPETGYSSKCRSFMRNPCTGISAKLLQNGAIYSGELIDFHPVSFRMELNRGPDQSFEWINSDHPVTIMLEKVGKLHYSGECRIVRRERLNPEREAIVVSPEQKNFSRFRPKTYRCIRHHLVPSPTICFRHPFTGRLVHLQSIDISSSGISVEEVHTGSTLLPGMMIPDLKISFAGSRTIQCVGQVLYRNTVNHDNGDSVVRCGILFLDMSLSDQLDLSSLLHHAIDHRTHVSSAVDLDALWKLFFESGFIYPEKFAAMYSNKEEFKETYKKLYLESPAIARHFVFQDRGTLYAHMSMLRFYSNSWLIHHHASSKIRKGRSGVIVLDQVGFYVNEFNSLISTHMSFVMCYYRKENTFPHRVFGGVTRDMNDPKASSLDTFTCFTVPRNLRCTGTGDDYALLPASREDLTELKGAYEKHSGGLMLNAMDLTPDSGNDEELNGEFLRYGFSRERKIHALKRNNELAAVITDTHSNPGLNLSNLTNCIHIFLLEKISQLSLYSALSELVADYPQEHVSVMMYPFELAASIIPDYEKTYTLWVLNLQNSDGYFESLRKTFKRSQYEQSIR